MLHTKLNNFFRADDQDQKITSIRTIKFPRQLPL